MKFLLLILIALVIIGVLVLLAKAGSSVVGSVKNSKERKALAMEHRKTADQLQIAEKYLRVIANGAGKPEYEAQEALDTLNLIRYPRTKELS